MSLSNLHSHVALWLRLVENPSHGVLSSIPTSYLDSAKRSQASYAATLVSLAVLHQCRLEVLSITEDLKSTGSWAALNDSQTQLSHLRLRFRRSMKEIGGSLTQHVSHMTASDTPFGKVQWEKTGTMRWDRGFKTVHADLAQEHTAQHLRLIRMERRK